jgi:branched-chain amino acid transport system substrate-binding protein
MRRRFVVPLALALVALGACGDDSDSDSGSEATTAPTTGSTTATSGGGGGGGGGEGDIVIEGVAQAQFYPGLEDGAKARVERFNRDGGLDGRMIDFRGVRDDNSSADTNLSTVRSLVQNDDVFAVVPVASAVFLPQSSDFLNQNQTPYVGWGFMPGFCEQDYGFGFNGCLVDRGMISTATMEPIIEQSGMDPSEIKIAFQAGDDDAGRSGNQQYNVLAEHFGVEVVYDETNIPVGGGVTDYSPYAQAIIAADPDIVMVSTDFASAIGLTGTLNASGYDGLIMAFVTYAPGLLETQPDVAQALEGSYVNIQIPPQEEQSPAIKQIESDLEAIGLEPQISFGTAVGYWQADVFIAALEQAGPEATPEMFGTELSTSFTYEPELEGSIGPMSWPDNGMQAAPCAALVQIVDGAYTSARPFECYENIEG